MVSNLSRPQEAKKGAWMAISRVRQEVVAWNHSAQQLVARRVRLLLHLCPCWARAPILLLLHVARALQPPATTPVVTLHHAGGGLRASLQDVSWRTTIGALILALPHVALL
jgi:hypothetical protein